ncbi:hypothetical protein PQX77_019009 [Marasmius sp. AFHP31]|nr:hypothetical protein PQX77_019009 [Marasmius sp. AFHP31]
MIPHSRSALRATRSLLPELYVSKDEGYVFTSIKAIHNLIGQDLGLGRRKEDNDDDGDSITFPEEYSSSNYGRGQSKSSAQTQAQPTPGAPMTVQKMKQIHVPTEDDSQQRHQHRQPHDTLTREARDHVRSHSNGTSPATPPGLMAINVQQENEMVQQDDREFRPAREHISGRQYDGHGQNGEENVALPIPPTLRPGGVARDA